MLAVDFFSWWYGSGWKSTLDDIKKRFQFVYAEFSIDIISQTLFSPWRQIITYPSVGFGNRFRALIDNLISRVIGLIVRMVVIFTALVLFLLIALTGVVEVIVWPLLPLAVVFFIVRSIL